jgi:hypothetical protein
MSLLKHRSVRYTFAAAGAVLGLMAGGLLRPSHLSAQAPPPRPKPTPDQIVAEMHEGFEEISKELGGLTDDEKTKLAAMEKKVGDELKADPKKAESRDFEESTFTDFRGVLNADHQKKFDDMMAKMKQRAGQASNASHLHQIGLMALLYENDHQQKIPPDLGALSEEMATPEVFLTSDSKTKAPADWKTMDDKAKAEWINKNTDFVYLANGKTGPLDANFVMSYIKPELATGGNAFLMGDGRVLTKSAEESKPVIEELKAGKNPAPSLKE